MPPSHPPAVSLLCTSPQLCEEGSQRHFRPPVSLTRPNRFHFACSHERFTSKGSDMEAVDPSKRSCLCDSFHAATNNIAKNSLLVDSTPTMGNERSGTSCVKTCPSNPYSSCTRIRSLSSTHPQGSTGQDPFPPEDAKYNTSHSTTP